MVDPVVLVAYSVTESDAIRYYLLREIPFGADEVLLQTDFNQSINSDLLKERPEICFHGTAAMAQKYFFEFSFLLNVREDELDQKLIQMATELLCASNAMRMYPALPIFTLSCAC